MALSLILDGFDGDGNGDAFGDAFGFFLAAGRNDDTDGVGDGGFSFDPGCVSGPLILSVPTDLHLVTLVMLLSLLYRMKIDSNGIDDFLVILGIDGKNAFVLNYGTP